MHTAIVADDNSMLSILFSYKIDGKSLKENDAIKIAIEQNNLSIIKKFMPGRKFHINIPQAIHLADIHQRAEIANFLISQLPVPGNSNFLTTTIIPDYTGLLRHSNH